MNPRRGVAKLVCLAIFAACSHAPRESAIPAGVGGRISPGALRVHMEILASDSLEGRLTGSPGYALAARYVGAKFAAAGLQPAGTDGWLTPVLLHAREVRPDKTSLMLILPSGSSSTFAFSNDFVVTQPATGSTSVESPVVFVGYGLTVAARSYDDYASVDVNGKIVAYTPGAPAGFTRDERVFYESTKIRNAVAHGAAAILRLWTPEEARTEQWSNAVRSYDEARIFTWSLDETSQEALWLGPSASKLILDSGSRSEASRPIVSRLSIEGTPTTITSPNVIGMLRGSDRKLRNEYIVVSAHLDHLGISRIVNGDSIYNGAVDNASGVAGLIELARSLSAARERRRSILFVAFTGEEPGSIGSEYFVRHPPVSLENIVANVNIDGLSMWSWDGIVPRGSEHSTLGPAIAAAAARAGIPISPDPTPDRYTIAGSDQYTFLTHGIPSVIFTAARSGAARQAALDWVRNRYHAPSDDMSQPLDFAAGARFTEALGAIILGIANGADRPAWNVGDFFAGIK
jgi:hypothetical protein